MKKIPNPYLGRWRILEMEQWDKDFIDLIGEGHITFQKKNRGELHFGAVECDLDCRIEKVGETGADRVLISWARTKEMKSLAEDGRY